MDKIKIFYSKEDEGYIASYKLLSGFGKTEFSALKELTTAMSGALECEIEDSRQAIKERDKLFERLEAFILHVDNRFLHPGRRKELFQVIKNALEKK